MSESVAEVFSRIHGRVKDLEAALIVYEEAFTILAPDTKARDRATILDRARDARAAHDSVSRLLDERDRAIRERDTALEQRRIALDAAKKTRQDCADAETGLRDLLRRVRDHWYDHLCRAEPAHGEQELFEECDRVLETAPDEPRETVVELRAKVEAARIVLRDMLARVLDLSALHAAATPQFIGDLRRAYGAAISALSDCGIVSAPRVKF